MVKKEVKELVEGTPAADSIKTKTGNLAAIIAKMQGMSHDDITKFSEVIKQVGSEDNLGAKDMSAQNRASVAMKTVKEDLASIFGDDNEKVSAEFLDEIATLFEAALNVRVALIQEELFEEAAEVVEEEVEARMEALTEDLDDYLDSVITEWKEENALAIESSLRLEQMESFFGGLKDLYEDHNIEIPEEEANIVEGLVEEVDELKERLNEALNKNLEYEEILEQAHLEQVFDDVSEGLAATQVEKFRTLVEGLNFSDLEDYKKKVSLVKEANFKGTSAPKNNSLNEEVILEEAPKKVSNGDPVNAYAAAITRNLRK